MFIDARTIEQKKAIESDVCIVGAGVAGITMALEFQQAGFDCCIIESGGFKPQKATQSLYYGENVGIPYYPLDTARGRWFAGTAHYWCVKLPGEGMGVRLRSMDPIDFEERDWVPHSGWPFAKDDLEPFYTRAHEMMRIGPNSYDPRDWADPVGRPELPFIGSRVQTTMFQFARRDLFFKDFRQIIDHTENVKIYLNSNVVEIVTDDTGATVKGLKVACLNGRKFDVQAKLFILAMGGIETPRLMLLSNRVQPNGLGNQHDLVGRFFMEHPHLWTGNFVAAHPGVTDAIDLYDVFNKDGIAAMGKITLNDQTLRKEKLLNWVTSIHPDYELSYKHYMGFSSPGVTAYGNLKKSVIKNKKFPKDGARQLKNMLCDGKSLARAFYRKVTGKFTRDFDHSKLAAVSWLNPMVEQAPNPLSRVMLADEKDVLGQRRVKLDWQLTELDKYTYTRAQEILDDELRRAGLGHLIIHTRADEIPQGIHGGWHHMGTTRMHRDPRKGVVDENCKVHGIANLFIAGASVFPTSGYANPVLTTMALVLRLSDHIKHIMARP
jgi:choline dehydrogenase-like flavoprotein